MREALAMMLFLMLLFAIWGGLSFTITVNGEPTEYRFAIDVSLDQEDDDEGRGPQEEEPEA